jgi:hypothetical protein
MLSIRAPSCWCRVVASLAVMLIAAVWIVDGSALAQTTVAVDTVCPHRFAVSAGEPVFTVAYCARQPLHVSDGAARQAVVVIHGDQRNASSSYQSIERAATAAGVRNPLIVAPQFIMEQDATAHGLGNEMPHWGDGWKEGNLSRPTAAASPSPRVSSFTVVDEMLRRLADRALFPNLEQIVVAGHSAGGQFVHRFAAGSSMEELMRPLGIRLRYIVANPSSYLYFDEQRPVAERAGEFAIPSAAVLAACPRYNAYRYGLDNLNEYMGAVGSDRLQAQYASRNVVLLLGERDDDPRAPDLSTTCGANLQGAHRLERGNLYYSHLGLHFGPSIYTRQPKAIIPNAGHGASTMFNSAAGRAYLFEVDPAPPAPAQSR